MVEIFRLMGSIFVDSSEADKSISKTDKHAQGMGNTLVKGIGTAVKWGVALGTAGVAGATALLGIATKASSAAAEIDDMSQRTNLSAKTLQEYKYAAEQSGFSLSTIETSAKKLTVTMGNYASGNKTTIEAFKQLGLSAEGANGKLKSTDEMFPQIIGKLADMKDITERNALMVKIFGKSAMDMAPMLNSGSAGVKELTDKAHELGLVMSDESVSAGAKFDDTLATVKSSLGALVTKVGLEVLPIAQSMLQWVTDHMPQIQVVCSTVFTVIGVVLKAVSDHINKVLVPAFNSFWAWLQPNIPLIKKIIEDAFKIIGTAIENVSTAISNIIDWCIKYKDILIPVVAGISAAALAFGIYKLAIIAVTTVTKLASIATGAFGTVLAFVTSPIGLVVIAIGLLVAAGVLLYRNWDVIKAKATQIFGAIGKFIGGIVDGIKNSFKGMVNGVIYGLNALIRGLNKLKFSVPDWVPVLGGKKFGFNIPTIPSFAIGTKYLPDDMLIQAHKGEMIVPKSENPYANSNGKVLNKKEDRVIYYLITNLDGKEIARTIVDPMSDELQYKKDKENIAVNGGAY